MSEIAISRARFAALMYCILEQCYPDLAERATMLNRPAKYLFGVGVENKDISQSISGRMNQSGLATDVVNGVKLSNYCKEYDEGANEIVISKKHYFLQYLPYARISDMELDKVAEDLKIRYSRQFPPFGIRHFIFGNTVETQPHVLAANHPFAENIEPFAASKWYFYFYEYESATVESPKVIRLVMEIILKEDTYGVTLNNVTDAYVTYKGYMVEMTGRRLRMELNGEGKTMYFMAHMEPSGQKELYTGIFFKHTAERLIACSVVLHRIPTSEQHPKAEVFSLDHPITRQLVPQPILSFFEKKEYVFLKNIKQYDLILLEEWLKKKKEKRGEAHQYDLFISAPILAYKAQKDTIAKVMQNIRAIFQDFQHKDENAKHSYIDNLRRQLEAQVYEQLAGSIYPMDEKVEYFREEVWKLQDEIERVLHLKIHFALSRDLFDKFTYHIPKQDLDEESKAMKGSKALLLIVPSINLFSSCWVTLGWAMEQHKPIFLLYYDEESLPYIVREANIRDNIQKINLSTWKIPLGEAIKVLEQNALWRKLFVM